MLHSFQIMFTLYNFVTKKIQNKIQDAPSQTLLRLCRARLFIIGKVCNNFNLYFLGEMNMATDTRTHRVETMRIILKESNYAFSLLMENGGSNNVDFADYTSYNFIQSIRHVMQKPDLSRAQLAAMLRSIDRRKSLRDNDDNWASFMAHRLQNGSANSNIRNIG